MLKKLLSKIMRFEFANGRARLIAGGRLLELRDANTPLSRDLCVHTALFVEGKWHSSREGLWDIRKTNDALAITIDWKELPLRQLWQFKRIDNGFNLVVYLDVKSALDIEKMVAGVMLRSEYDTWFSNIEKGVFPAFGRDWENVFLQDVNAKVLGSGNAEGFPLVVCENLQHGRLLLQNAPQGYQSRALRVEVEREYPVYEPHRYKSFNLNFYLFTAAEAAADFIMKKNKQLVLMKQLEEDKLRVCVENTAVHVYWDNQRLTSNQGLHAALLINDEWFDSGKGEWNIERINDQCIYISIDWKPLPIKQFWQLNIRNGHSFIWKVKTQVTEKRESLIRRASLGLVLRPDYTQWFGGCESGFFPDAFGNWREMIADRKQGAIGVKNTASLPGVFFKNHDAGSSELLVQNGDEAARARFLQAIKENNSSAGPVNEDDFTFEQEISVAADDRVITEHIHEKINQEIMRQGMCTPYLAVVGGSGKMRLFWREKEITRDIGLHTALCSGGRWYDSGKAKWEINKISPEKLRVTVDFNPFPAVQVWELRLVSETELSWDIVMKVAKDVEINERKAGVILDGSYKEWFNSFEAGRFPERFGFWHDIVSNRDGETFGVYPADGRPGVMFSIDDTHMSLIQNTDENIRGRVLQGQVKESDETKVYPAAESVCFRGAIKFAPQRDEITAHKKRVQPLSYEPEKIYLYGDTSELHNRIAGVDEFDDKMNKINALKGKKKNFRLSIGVSRYNFFRLHEILQYAADCLDMPVDMRSYALNIFPLRRLRRNFIEYLEALKSRARELGIIEFVLTDDDLFDLITRVCSQADAGNERQLLRLLGILCEHAFIGPQIVVIDPYHRCNANCVHCWVHTPGVSHPPEYYEQSLDIGKFKRIADDLSELKVDLIIFQGDGEPLLHKHFFDMVEYARRKGIKVSFFTNGIALNNDIADKVIKYGVEEIFCSFPAGTPSTYAEINKKQTAETFHQVIDNLKYLCRLKKERGAVLPRLIMTHVIHTLNAHELVEMAENDIEIGADVMRFYLIRLDENIKFLQLTPRDLKNIQTAWGQVKELARGKDIQLLDTTEFQLANFEPETGSWSKNVFLEKGCALGWNFCLIPASGEVSFCCHLRTVGYLSDKSFKEIWNSPEYGRFRFQAKFLSKYSREKFLNGTRLFDDYCQHCDTHQVIRDVWGQFKLYNLEKFHSEEMGKE